jgi:hypothetical protein
MITIPGPFLQSGVNILLASWEMVEIQPAARRRDAVHGRRRYACIALFDL